MVATSMENVSGGTSGSGADRRLAVSNARIGTVSACTRLRATLNMRRIRMETLPTQLHGVICLIFCGYFYIVSTNVSVPSCFHSRQIYSYRLINNPQDCADSAPD